MDTFRQVTMEYVCSDSGFLFMFYAILQTNLLQTVSKHF